MLSDAKCSCRVRMDRKLASSFSNAGKISPGGGLPDKGDRSEIDRNDGGRDATIDDSDMLMQLI